MYSKQEASQLRQEFWTAFGQYMAPVLSCAGERINWINYKTGEKNISFRMNADNKKATIAIELSHKDPDIQQIFFDELKQLEKILYQTTGERWTWQLHHTDENGKLVSRIYRQITGVSVFKKEDWPTLISFFKQRMIALDTFWSQVKYRFEGLR